MKFELDRAGRSAEGERYYVYVYVHGEGKKRCIGQTIRLAESGLWAAYADGEFLACAENIEAVAQKLWTYVSARGKRPPGRHSAEWGVEERFASLRKRVPRAEGFRDQDVRRVQDVPLERRTRLLDDVDELIGDLEAQLLWWRKVRKELAIPARPVRVK